MWASLPTLMDDSTYFRLIRPYISASLTSLCLMNTGKGGAGG